MRYRRITYRYQEIVGKQPSLNDTWPGMPAFPVGGAGWRHRSTYQGQDYNERGRKLSHSDAPLMGSKMGRWIV